jgi:hypothetical protein
MLRECKEKNLFEFEFHFQQRDYFKVLIQIHF